MATAERKYPAPAVNPEIKPFFDAAAQGNLMLEKCSACSQSHFYPRAICPYCSSDRTEWVTSSGRGTIYSYSGNLTFWVKDKRALRQDLERMANDSLKRIIPGHGRPVVEDAPAKLKRACEDLA